MASNQSDREETGSAETIYTKSRELFAILCRHFRVSRLPKADKPRFSEQAGRFYLWGEAFCEGYFDTILKHSPTLHLSIVKLLAVIARLLLSRKSPVSNQASIYTDFT